MNIPAEVKPALWGALGGAAALALIGFTWGGWVTGGSADQLAKKEAEIAVVKVLAPICVDKFQQQPDAAANLIALKATSSYQQTAFIEKGGWATMVALSRALQGLVRRCSIS